MSLVRSRKRSIVTTALGPGEGRTGARVDAVPERDVLTGVRAVEPELGGVVELARVAVRGAVEHHHGGAGREVDAADGRRRPATAGSRP